MAIGRMSGERREVPVIAASAVGAMDNPFYAALDKLLRKSGLHNKTAVTPLLPLVQPTSRRATSSTAC